MNSQKLSFKKITFSFGGRYSREFAKPGFNLKIRGGKELFGRRQFKLRGDATDPSLMRSKLMCDIHDRLGLPSISANYALLYINDEYFGLYVLTDAYKESWIEYMYGEKDTTSLFKSEGCDLSFMCRVSIYNENKESTDSDKKDLYEFLANINKAKSLSDVESFFDLDQFYYEKAIEYLTSSWDHSIHNYYLYKNQKTNQWIYLVHDFDLDLGTSYIDAANNTMEIYSRYKVINNILQMDEGRFNEILKDIVAKVFNPATLFPRIDEIKSFIRPYVEKDKTPDANGQYPGRINFLDEKFYSMTDWENSVEFTYMNRIYGLKQFILLRYQFICQKHNLECDPYYLNNGIEYFENQNSNNETIITTPATTIISSVESPVITTSTTISISETPTPIEAQTTSTSESTPTTTSDSSAQKCLSEFIGYPCCAPGITTVYQQDDYGDWGYDFSKQEWCGLTKYEDSSSSSADTDCWSESLGYPCCRGCKVYEMDSDGSWGYELNEWCGIIPSHCEK